MNDQLDALLALQSADDAVQAIESRLAALAPRLSAFDAERQQAERALAQARAAYDRESERHAHLSERAQDFRRMNERAVAQLDQVRKAAHATAAGAQVDISRRALADAEAELHAAGLRLSTLRNAVTGAEERLAGIDEAQAPAREAVAAERGVIEGELTEARRARAERAGRVEARLLAKYDRVRSRRRGRAVFALRGFNCGSCNTAIPTQRRTVMMAGAIEVCESCGALLYAAPSPAEAVGA